MWKWQKIIFISMALHLASLLNRDYRYSKMAIRPGAHCFIENKFLATGKLTHESVYFWNCKFFFTRIDLPVSWNHWIRSPNSIFLRACLHGDGGPQIGVVTWGGSPHLSCKHDQIDLMQKCCWINILFIKISLTSLVLQDKILKNTSSQARLVRLILV